MGIFAGLSASIKWTGLAFLGLPGIIELIAYIKLRIFFQRIPRLLLYFVAIPFAIYFSIFLVHFSLLTKPGDGDAFMTPNFQSHNVWQKFTELNTRMYTANNTLTATHPYSSKWYTWPLVVRPIYYWNGANTEKIYLLGNPMVWWGSTVAVLYLLLSLFGRNFFKNKTGLILLGGYLINFLPFIGIGRVMFLYHYFAGLIFAILMFAYCLDKMPRPRNAIIAILSAAAILFIFFAPLSYGLPLNSKAFSNRMWLNSWR